MSKGRRHDMTKGCQPCSASITHCASRKIAGCCAPEAHLQGWEISRGDNWHTCILPGIDGEEGGAVRGERQVLQRRGGRLPAADHRRRLLAHLRVTKSLFRKIHKSYDGFCMD